MVTLGDMWSLMLTFFIMLFAMSQIDATKFKEVQGSVKTTFGFKQTLTDLGPPPGVSLLKDPTASASSGTDVSFFEPANNSIVDPHLAALKIQACERQIKKDANDVSIAKKNARLIRMILAEELRLGLFEVVEDGKEVSLLFSAKRAFDERAELTATMKKSLLKMGVAFSGTMGSVLVRAYMPKAAAGIRNSASQSRGTYLAGIVGDALMAGEKLSPDRLQIESMTNTRAPAAIKSHSESLSTPYFEISVYKD